MRWIVILNITTIQKKRKKQIIVEMDIAVLRDFDGSFELVIIPKRTEDISDIDRKVISM